jgi:hypothetical protein
MPVASLCVDLKNPVALRQKTATKSVNVGFTSFRGTIRWVDDSG